MTLMGVLNYRQIYLGIGLEDDPTPGVAVHHRHDVRVEADVPGERAVADRSLFGEPFPVDETVAQARAHGEVTDLERGEVLEEMRALGRIDADVAEARLDDRARAGDLLPLHRDAEE